MKAGRVLCGIALLAAPLAAQAPARLDSLVSRLAGMTAVSGYERALADTMLRWFPGAALDRAGNVVLVIGSGAPKRLVACPLDEPGYVVGNIRPDGWSTLRRVGNAPSPLFDQQLEGHRVTVFGRRGPLAGVVAVRSVHLTRGRAAGSDAPFSADDAYLDIGARSGDEARAAGVDVLSPVALEKVPQRYGTDLIAAPVAGRRAACAALLDAARGVKASRGTTVVAFVVEQGFTRRGINTVGRNLGPFASTRLVDAAPASGNPPPLDQAVFGTTSAVPLKVRYRGTAVETVSLADVAALADTIAATLKGGE
jgi:putative aminopeptidase